MNSGSRCAGLFIKRSSGHPLTFYTFLNVNQVALLDDILYVHGFRARAIHLGHESGLSAWETISVLNRLPWSAPQIELFVYNAFIQETEIESVAWRVFTVEVSPLKGLRLHLSSLWDCLPTNSFPNLTHLLLWSASSDDYFADSLLALLSRASMLQHLQLITANLVLNPISHPPLSLVSLSRIRTLSIHFTELESALILLRHLDLPAECAVCIGGGGSRLDFSDPSTFPRPDAVNIPPLRVLDAVTSLDLSASFDGFLIGGHNAPDSNAGFFIEASACLGSSAWLARLPSILPAPFSSITVLHANLDELETIPLILPPTLEHLSRLHELCCLLRPLPTSAHMPNPNTRALVEAFLGVLLPTTNHTTPCAKLQVLVLEAEIALADFPFSGLEYTAAARKDAGFPLRRFMFHPHTRRHDSDGVGTRARFAESFVPLAALVDVVEHRRAGDTRVCPFRSPSGGCWDVEQAEKYWELPRGLMSYDRDPDPCCDDLNSGIVDAGGK